MEKQYPKWILSLLYNTWEQETMNNDRNMHTDCAEGTHI